MADESGRRAPVPIERRTVMTSAALGLTSLSLPSALAAASIVEVQPSGAFSYLADDRVLSYWEAAASGEVVSTGVAATGAYSGVSGTFSAAGPVYPDFNSWSAAGQPNPSLYGDGNAGIISSNDGNSDFSGGATGSSIDLVTTPSPNPYLQYTFSATGASFLLQTFVLQAARKGLSDAFNLAIYVQAPSASFVLRRTAALSQAPQNLVVPLAASGVSVGDGQTLTVRVYPYATSSSNALKLYKPETSASLSAISPDTVDAAQGRFTGWTPAKTEGTERYTGTQYQEITAAFIGRPA